MPDKFNIGIIGAGNFACFAAEAFIKVDGISIQAVADVNAQTGKSLADHLDAIYYDDYEQLLALDNIHIVYIATPPFLHYDISKKALEAGKHVICEKPAALHANEAEELQKIAAGRRSLFVVNLMQRYNPFYTLVQRIIDQHILGDFLHGFFENYASDENLNDAHWFWDEKKSGGIFIEHGVHFFDMFSGWLGDGKIISAIETSGKPDNQHIRDQVQASVKYQNGIVNFYHGFNQPSILDRQEMRLQFERGDITLYEWIPGRLMINGLLKIDQLEIIKQQLELFATVQYKIEHSDSKKNVTGNFKKIHFDEYFIVEAQSLLSKSERYQSMLTEILKDQISWIGNKEFTRKITDKNAVASLTMAVEAHEKSVKI